MGVQRLSHVGLCVSDLTRSITFYRDLLGFRPVSQLQIGGEITARLLMLPDVELQAMYLERDGVRLELLHYAVPGVLPAAGRRRLNQVGLTHLSFRVDDLPRVLDRLRTAGVEIHEESRIDVPDFGAAAVFVTDPDGTLIELVQSPGDPAQLPGVPCE